MGVSTVILNNETLMTVNDTTATASQVAAGEYYYAADGTKTVGTGTTMAVGITDTTDTAGGTIREITAISLGNDTVTAEHLESGYTAHDAQGNAITGSLVPGGGTVSRSDVNFYDYDGSLVASHTKAEINAMTSDSDLPTNPSHTGLTAQGWNWTVAQLKAQLTAMPDQPVDVGQMYITTSGATEIDVIMQDGRLSPILTLAVNGTVSVDWGDNTTPDTVTGTSLSTMVDAGPHTYASAGSYTIKISVTSGTFTFYNNGNKLTLRRSTVQNENRVYANCIKNVRIGVGVNKIGIYAFTYCQSLATITIPNSVADIGANSFSCCYSLTSITIPSGITSISASMVYYCYSLASIAIPSSVTSFGVSVFGYCDSLTNITIPSGVTSIGASMFNYCHSLSSLIIPNGITTIGGSMFYDCYSLSSITIPNSVTILGTSLFYDCHSLTSIAIPSGVTKINSGTFYYCYSLTSITIPSGVTSIDTNAFNNCRGIATYYFKPTTPPALTNTNTFSNIPSDCVIYVPYSADHSILNAYQTASIWSNYASYMQEEQAPTT